MLEVDSLKFLFGNCIFFRRRFFFDLFLNIVIFNFLLIVTIIHIDIVLVLLFCHHYWFFSLFKFFLGQRRQVFLDKNIFRDLVSKEKVRPVVEVENLPLQVITINLVKSEISLLNTSQN